MMLTLNGNILAASIPLVASQLYPSLVVKLSHPQRIYSQEEHTQKSSSALLFVNCKTCLIMTVLWWKRSIRALLLCSDVINVQMLTFAALIN